MTVKSSLLCAVQSLRTRRTPSPTCTLRSRHPARRSYNARRRAPANVWITYRPCCSADVLTLYYLAALLPSTLTRPCCIHLRTHVVRVSQNYEHIRTIIFPFQIINFREWKPAIHLDNRYRLMRHEPMLDADGNVTEEIGEDETAPPTLEEVLAMETEGCKIIRPRNII